jgi:hypothetical protein
LKNSSASFLYIQETYFISTKVIKKMCIWSAFVYDHLFMFLSSPKQTKCTLENDVIHHCKHETIISCSTQFWY